ncbi:MAG TPA: hypothetical protein VMU16_03185 [Candidatus Binataceae bacterium]|nr:hypothetical protein [Candidatus Binataceae bacterium]
MAGHRMEIDLPEELFERLVQVARLLEIASPEEAAVIGLADWVSRRGSELDDKDPNSKYPVNEALDELIARKK